MGCNLKQQERQPVMEELVNVLNDLQERVKESVERL
jgi:hypothetical protein